MQKNVTTHGCKLVSHDKEILLSRKENQGSNFKMGEAVAGNDDRSLWEEARKMSKCTNKLPNTMDCKTDEIDISHIFSENYRSLYNSVGYSKRNMDILRKDIASRITNGCANNSEMADHKHSITVSE